MVDLHGLKIPVLFAKSDTNLMLRASGVLISRNGKRVVPNRERVLGSLISEITEGTVTRFSDFARRVDTPGSFLTTHPVSSTIARTALLGDAMSTSHM